MSNTIATILTATMVSAGVLAELNLLRMFAQYWREDRRLRARRRFRPSPTPKGGSAPHIVSRQRNAIVSASLLGVMIPSASLAQQSPTSSEPAASTTAAVPEPAPLVISTDRPSFSDGTGIVPVGHFQLETGYTFTFRNRDDVETQRHNGPEILARVALVEDRFELRFITSGYTWSRTDDGSGSGYQSTEGWNDMTLGFKLKICDQSGGLPRLALGAQTTLGVGSDDISNQIAEPTLKLIWSYDLGQSFGDDWKGFTLGGNGNISWPTTDGNRFTQGQGSVYLSFPIADRLSGFAEYYVIGPNSKDSDAAHYLDFGGTYLLNNRVQLDGRVGFGLNQEADNVYVGIGISFLF